MTVKAIAPAWFLFVQLCVFIFAIAFTVFASAVIPASSAAVAKTFSGSGLPGFCAESFSGKHVLDHYVGGYADATRKKKYDLNTIQPVASISKTVIGLALAQLAVKGEIDLDVPVDEYLPWKVRNPRFPKIPITLRELATHTSSLIDSPVYARAYQTGHQPRMSMREFVKLYTDPRGAWFSPANFAVAKPGTHYEYSNIGADLAAVVLEYVTGESFSRYASEHIFVPIGMKGTSYTYRASDMHSTLFGRNGHPLKPYALVTYADGGMQTSCNDLTQYFQAVLRARSGEPSPLSANVVRMALAPQFKAGALPSGLENPNQGLFWSFDKDVGIGHDGGDPGVASSAYLAFHHDRGFVFVTNTSVDDNPRYAKSLRGIWRAWHPLKQ